MRYGVQLIGVLFAAVSVTPDVRSIVKQFEARYRSARTLKAAFLERYFENGRLVRVEAGTAYFLRPGRMRWEYESPEKNLFLVDGKTAWFYVPADHTVTRVPAKESADWRTPLSLLAGETKVSRVCAEIQSAPNETPESSDNSVFRCFIRQARPIPRAQNSSHIAQTGGETADTILFEIVRNSGDLVRVVARDPGGVAFEFHFGDWVTNPHLADSFFQFTVPPSVAIVNGESLSTDKGMNH
jgi:outer membrane lipoprotein carrier protein